MANHALLSASSSHRWLNCPPSARLSESYDDKGSNYAAEGTDAHELCEYKLRQALGIEAKDPTENLTWFNEEMEECANGYASFVMELVEEAKKTCADPVVLIEQRLDYSKYVEEGFGTGDCVVIADGTLHIVDYKHGKGVQVEADDNPQMIVVSNHAAMVSSSIGAHTQSRLALLTFDEEIVREFVSEFNDYLEKCIPLLIPYEVEDGNFRFLQCLKDLWSTPSSRIYKGPSLSAITTPVDILNSKLSKSLQRQTESVAAFENIQKSFIELLQLSKYTEIIRLPTPEEVANGRALMAVSDILENQRLFYTPQTYLLHLQRVLELLDQYENYQVIIREDDLAGQHVLMISENYQAWLRENNPPYKLYKIIEQSGVSTCRRYLEQFIDETKSGRMNKNIVIDKIENMIALVKAL